MEDYARRQKNADSCVITAQNSAALQRVPNDRARPQQLLLPPDARPQERAQRDAELRTGSSAFTWSSRATATACSKPSCSARACASTPSVFAEFSRNTSSSRWSGAPSGWRPPTRITRIRCTRTCYAIGRSPGSTRRGWPTSPTSAFSRDSSISPPS